jgi:adenine-specific DNA methylase
MIDKPRLIEVAFPLKQTSLDSVHEKNVRHGHISTLHIWPARRPLAACRAALIATLLPDPGNAEERQKILEKLAGHVVPTVKKKTMPSGKIEEIKAEKTVGGILHWGRESGPDLEWFREAIRKAYDGRAPKVLDPFAGGGAIPLEAMRLGCEATAIDINPVAWFILKCTLEYPQRLAGQKLALPDCALGDREFMAEYFERSLGLKGASLKRRLKQHFGEHEHEGEFHALRESASTHTADLKADLAWHVRAWGKWVLKQARNELAASYPTYATWEPVLETVKRKVPKDWLRQWKKEHAAEIKGKGLLLCPLTDEGEVDSKKLNEEFAADYLEEPTNPRWVPKPTVAYLWARTVRNKHHPETIIPLLKTRWLCKRDDKRVLLTMMPRPDGTGVEFGIENDVAKIGGNTAQRREHDRKAGAGTMTRSGVKCPIHGNILTMQDIQLEGQDNRLDSVMTAVVIDGADGKEFRLSTAHEIDCALRMREAVTKAFQAIPFGIPTEPLTEDSKRNTWCVQYGVTTFNRLFTSRQLASLGTILTWVRRVGSAGANHGYNQEWREAIGSLLAIGLDKQVDRMSMVCRWDQGYSKINSTFTRFALPILWDYCEGNPFSKTTGNWISCVEWVCETVEHVSASSRLSPSPVIINQSATGKCGENYDAVVTDPPYYDAIGYSVLMDFFYVWLRRSTAQISEAADSAFADPLSPKWDNEKKDGELVDDSSRHSGDSGRSKAAYEEGMARVFQSCHAVLRPDGRLVIVFANKHPDAWETLVSAIIRAGFVVDGSWPIQTEMPNRSRSHGSAALSSSVWLVCKKRNPMTRPGWDNSVLQQMRERITTRLRDFWDAGISGPDFVWAATGPAMEAYSQYPVVKKANKPNELMSVSEFLRHVRRMVLDFVVGRVLSKVTGGEEAATEEMDDVTTYYLLHRNDFKMDEAPSGACILYCVSCNLSDRDLVDAFDLLAPSGGTSDADEEEEAEVDDDAEMAEGTSSTFKLKPWNKRKRPGMGYDPVVDSPKARMDAAQGKLFDEAAPEKPRTRIIPLIDQIHRLMHLWRAGDVVKVDEYLNSKGLRTNALFPPVLQALIEMADAGSEERAILESLSNHVQGRSERAAYQAELPSNEVQGGEMNQSKLEN